MPPLRMRADEAKLLRKLVQIRGKKEQKLRRQTVKLRDKQAELFRQQAMFTMQRNALLVELRQQTLPEEVLSIIELAKFKHQQIKKHQHERELAEKIMMTIEESKNIESEINRLNIEIQKLIKNQEKLQVVINE